MKNVSISGSKYFVVFKDDFSGCRQVFFLKKTDEVAKCLETFLSEASAAGNTQCDYGDPVEDFIQQSFREAHPAPCFVPVISAFHALMTGTDASRKRFSRWRYPNSVVSDERAAEISSV
ncbi:hypothetical protein M513_00002 [Trichuris suis]|uniref:Uncharacterized protein n=1 Tax=Trichuris suis TaxID=68888 RepID=A0A085MNP3_9BILA|nr:hypothetical protein M513_00002 [Trichuris suis]